MENLKIRLSAVLENVRRLSLGGSYLRTCLGRAAALLIISLAFVATDVRADTLDFLFTGTGSGSLDGVEFTDRNFSVMISADTDNIIVDSGDGTKFYEFLTGTIDIDGFGVSTFVDLLCVFRNPECTGGSPCLGFGAVGRGDLISLYESGVGIAEWDMLTSFGPIFTATPRGQFSIPMDTGILTFTAMSDVTFTASIDLVIKIEELIVEVALLDLARGINMSLDAKLDSAVDALQDANDNNDVAAQNKMQAFINAVEAQRDVHISSGEADFLIDLALEILADFE